MEPKIMLCSCGDTQPIDGAAIAQGTGLSVSSVHRQLCTSELSHVADAIEAGEVIVACGQMSRVFDELAEDLGQPAPLAIDIRDRAGWSDEGGAASAKMTALITEGQLGADGPPTYDVESAGTCLVIGPADVALDLAARLADELAVTVVISDGVPELVAPEGRFDIAAGRLRTASGSFTRFAVSFDGFAVLEPTGRGAPVFSAPRDGARSECDIIVDLSGEPALFPAPEKRDGYLRADPRDGRSVDQLVLQAAGLKGTFEKPLYIRFEESLCAHSRAGQAACSRCLNFCTTGAISPDGETVAVAADICAGCGACAAACPSGAISYEAPTVATLFARLQALAETYRSLSEVPPRLLVHDGHGAEMISLMARHGRGLPANVIPFEVSSLAAFGHAEQLAALGMGFGEVCVALSPTTEREAVESEIALGAAIAGDGRIRMMDPETPDALEAAVWEGSALAVSVSPILPLGNRRQTTRLAAQALHPGRDTAITLPDFAPYGAVLVDKEACTLCLACASLCPTGALTDDPDAPRLLFQQDACIQCGLCANVCPEDAIALKPELNLSESALREIELNAEEPALCISCEKPFGVQSTIDRIVAKLEGQHPMFSNSDNARLIRMCDDCRITAQYHSEAQPFSSKPRPRPRTTDDYKKH